MGMAAKARLHDKTEDELPGDGPERTCAVTRAQLASDELIRFVRGPDGAIVPDLACRLPGRGVWVGCSSERVGEAARRNVFAKSLKRPVTVPADLAQQVEFLIKTRAASALSLAVKAGLALAGFTKVEKAVDRGEAIALIHASDAAADGRNKLDRKFKAILADLTPGIVPEIIADLTSEELSLAMGRLHVVHAALAKGGAAQNFIKEAGRLRRYRSQCTGETAPPSASKSDTEHA